MKVTNGYTFDDVLLVPKHSEIPSRSQIDLSVDLGKGIKLGIPIVSANMKNVTGREMAVAISAMGGLPILHRFLPTDDIVSMFVQADEETEGFVGASIGVQEDDKELAMKLWKAGCKVICVDVAHGDHDNCARMVEWLSGKGTYMAGLTIIAGNVATKAGALRLYNSGASVIKVGIGPGSLCTTRIETGNGVPQLTALENVYGASFDVREKRSYPLFPTPGIPSVPLITNEIVGRKFKIIADGGIKNAGDIVKALCFSDVVMLGNLLAGTDEAPGVMVTVDGKAYKEYAGSSTHKTNHVEGVSALVPTKGPVADIIGRLMEGVRSGLSYQGAKNLEELREDPEFVSISGAGLKESHPHDVHLLKK